MAKPEVAKTGNEDPAQKIERLEREIKRLELVIAEQNKWYSTHTVHTLVQKQKDLITWVATIGSADEWLHYDVESYPDKPVEWFRLKMIQKYRPHAWTR